MIEKIQKISMFIVLIFMLLGIFSALDNNIDLAIICLKIQLISAVVFLVSIMWEG
jgi:hypothetical protein